MTKFAKARWETNGNEIHLGMEFSKVDKQRRMVAGWATVDNVDTEGDVVTAQASVDAFQRSRRNLREMHKKDSAVGRIVSFKEDTFRAPDGKTYNGIFVKVYVSKGAQNTWEKVLDGTLNGFSIGGNIIEAEEDFNKATGEKIRKVTKYDLNELSLVDNPGNQYSDFTNVFKIRKSADGSVTSLTGMIEDTKILNVFYCDHDSISKESANDSYSCPVCEELMVNIGFAEDGSDREEKVSTLVTKYISEGGVNMLKKNKNEEVDGDKNVSQDSGGNPLDYVNDEDAKLADPTQDVDGEEETEDVDEVGDEGEEIQKRIDSLKTDIAEILSKSSAQTAEKLEALEKTIGETRELLDQRFEQLEKRYTTIHTDLETTKSKQADLERSLSKINSGGAFKKSADLDEPAEPVQKSDNTWNGAFSVDNLF
jgi:phage head maturation protease/DNA-binding protein H-NS